MPQGIPTPLFVRKPQVVEALCEAIRAGNYREVACEFAGVNARTAERWFQRGDKARDALDEALDGLDPQDIPEDAPDGAYVRFCVAVKKAEADRETGLAATVRAGEAGWQACAWLLERGRPQRWAKRTDISFANDDGAQPIINVNIGVRGGTPADVPPDGAER